jgi:hypothetical protein
MQFATKQMTRVAMIMLIVAAVSSLASAQALPSGGQAITLNATMPESLTLNLSANAVNFALAPNTASNPGSTNITATTSWILGSGRTAVGVYAYFTNSASALNAGTNNIPSSAFQISNNGGALNALTNSVAFGGANAGLQLASVAITGANQVGNRTDNMTFNINTTGLTLPAAAYTGTLNIQAQATP